MDNPLISIIVPVYKVEDYLGRCVDSMLNQTYTNLEIILVDDGSPDGCGQICDAYAARDNRVHVIHKQNEGLGCARNSGLEICSGEFIMFVDSDDSLSGDAVQVLYDRMTADGSDMAMGKHTDLYPDGHTDGRYCSGMVDSLLSGEQLLDRMDGSCNIPVSVWGNLYRRKLFSEIRFPALRCGEDLWTFIQVAGLCDSISVVNHTLYFYLQRESSVMHKKTEDVKKDELSATLFAASFLQNRGHRGSARYWYHRGVSKALEFADRQTARELLRQYFDRKETGKMLAGSGMKPLAKWVVLHSAAAGKLYDWAKAR